MPAVFQGKGEIGQFPPRGTATPAPGPSSSLGLKLKNELFGSENLSDSACASAGCISASLASWSQGQFLGIDLDDTAFIPAGRAQELFNREGVDESTFPPRRRAFGHRRRRRRQRLIARHSREDFTIVTQEEMLKTLSNILDVLTLAVGALGAFLCWWAGRHRHHHDHRAVSERTGEIGLLVALGAAANHPALFLGEAVALSALGGGFGLALGIGLAQTIQFALHPPSIHPVAFVVLAEAVAIAIGLVAGVITGPSGRSSRSGGGPADRIAWAACQAARRCRMRRQWAPNQYTRPQTGQRLMARAGPDRR